jgi:hypothetical protein
MSAPTLQVRKLSYSVHPWRIGLLHADGRFEAIPHLTFARKRDAVPVLAALQALDVDWRVSPDTWTTTVREAVHALVETAPGWQVHQRGLRAWETTP